MDYLITVYKVIQSITYGLFETRHNVWITSHNFIRQGDSNLLNFRRENFGGNFFRRKLYPNFTNKIHLILTSRMNILTNLLQVKQRKNCF